MTCPFYDKNGVQFKDGDYAIGPDCSGIIRYVPMLRQWGFYQNIGEDAFTFTSMPERDERGWVLSLEIIGHFD